MTPLALTDADLTRLLAVAAAVPRADRAMFLRATASAYAGDLAAAMRQARPLPPIVGIGALAAGAAMVWSKRAPKTPEAQRRAARDYYRRRTHARAIKPHITVGPLVIEALIERAKEFLDKTDREADALSRDRKWVAAQLADVLDEWAAKWLE